MPSRPFVAVLLAALAVAGCDRPFVALDPPRVEVVSPDLDVVQTGEALRLALRVTATRGVARVAVNGVEVTMNGGPDLYLDTLALAPGLNTVVVDALDADGNEGRDTLYALRLDLRVGRLAFALPEPLAGHTATPLGDGRALVAGGFAGDGRARTDALLVAEDGFSYSATPAPGGLAEARAGHTASPLPDGRVLVVGGARAAEPAAPSDFVTAPEIFDPTTGRFAAVASGGVPVRRSQHTAAVLASGGRTFVYLYGGRAPLGGGVGTDGSLSVLELRQTTAGDSLVNLSPAGGVGSLDPVAGHVQLPLPDRGGAARTLVAGAYAPPGAPQSASAVAFRLRYRPSTTFFPFALEEEPTGPPDPLRTEWAAAPLGQYVFLFTGGRAPEGPTAGDLQAFADGAGRFFQFPGEIALGTFRRRHTATRMPSGRILLLGGQGPAGQVLASAELVFPAN